MTYKELAKYIAELPEGEQNQEVLFLEPYDKGKEVFPVTLSTAPEDIFSSDGLDRRVIHKGQLFLE